MDKHRRQILTDNLFLQSELSRVLLLAHKDNLKIVVLKGLSHLDELYPDPSLRPVGDMDLLVAKEDLDRAANLLQHSGYKWIFQNRGNHHCFTNSNTSGRQMLLELHYELFNRGNPWFSFSEGFRAEDCLRRLRSRTFSGAPGYALAYEDELTYAALHGIKEVFTESKWLEDIRRMITLRAQLINWKSWWQDLKSKGLARAVGFAVYAAKLEAPSNFLLPDELEQCLIEFGRVEAWEFFAELHHSGTDLWDWRPALFTALVDGWSARFRALFSAVPYWWNTHFRPTLENSTVCPFTV